jgi:hypothetical protein
LRSPCCASIRFFIASFSGPIDDPSPKICVVTPWRISPWERPSTSSDSVDHDSMLMKPGATAMSWRRSTIAARARRGRRPPRRGRRGCRRRRGARVAAAVVDRPAANHHIERLRLRRRPYPQHQPNRNRRHRPQR